jgi:hypothetical protein
MKKTVVYRAIAMEHILMIEGTFFDKVAFSLFKHCYTTNNRDLASTFTTIYLN